jgi:aerobic-type carbon monoxide dehydrogenase small subunit (CoxS/CutS family)
VTLRLVLNGRPAALDADPGETLLDVLRREAGLLSVRPSCGIGVCGACTVLLDGEPVSGCLLRAAQAAGREVTTVEGIPAEHPVRRAFAAEHAFQCGYCTPGMVLTVAGMLEETPEPSDEQIVEGLGGNLCRCGCYVKIHAAVRRAAAA